MIDPKQPRFYIEEDLIASNEEFDEESLNAVELDELLDELDYPFYEGC